MTTELKHPKLNVWADREVWTATRQFYITKSGDGGTVSDRGSTNSEDMNPLLVIGMQVLEDPKPNEVVVWAMQEQQRRREERTRATAHAKEAEAINNLADAIRGASEDDVLARILGKVSERTRCAVLQQLKKARP